jgi:hypothetical protein
LASIQNNENGDPFWIVSGNWRTNLLDIANQSQTASQENMTGQGTSAPVPNYQVVKLFMDKNLVARACVMTVLSNLLFPRLTPSSYVNELVF